MSGVPSGPLDAFEDDFQAVLELVTAVVARLRHMLGDELGEVRVLVGRKVCEGLAAYWPTAGDETGFAERTNSLPKYVASRTLAEPLSWNASLIKGDLAEGVAGIKRQ